MFRTMLPFTLAFTILAPAIATAQTKPTITIMSPPAGQQLSGDIELKAKADGFTPSTIFVGLTPTNWQPMTHNDQTGEWTATLDTTMVPSGGQTLAVVTDNKKVRAAANVTVDNPLKVFFADLHSHTSYSDGTLTPAVAHDYARNTAKLDVFCLTDHLESVDDAEWLDTREVAFDANVDGEFVAFPGLEWTKRWGHINIYDPKTRHWPADPQAFYQAAADAGIVAKFNHPGDGSKTHARLAYAEVGDRTVQLMEVRQPAEEKAFIRALDAGWHIAPEGSDDTHSANWGNCRSWTGIYAPGLSKANILDALAKRRCYSTLDRNCRLMFRVNDAYPGDIVGEPVQEVEVGVQVADPDEGEVIAKIELIEDGEVVDSDEGDGQGHCWRVTRTPAAGKHYYFAKVTQADGNLLWSAPVWVTVAGE